jgi:hypothetical protein
MRALTLRHRTRFWDIASAVLVIALIGPMLSGCAALRVGTDFDRSAKFSGYHTFSWMPREYYGTRNPLVV